jgi:peptide-methionine (S)-S-oxide reductase
MHDPTTKNQQGGDRGSQYRSVIFYTDEAQKSIAERITMLAGEKYGGKVSTTLEPASAYIKGEDYHQGYLDNNPNGYECSTHFERSWETIVKKFGGK